MKWYLRDIVGSVRDITDSNGSLKDHLDYGLCLWERDNADNRDYGRVCALLFANSQMPIVFLSAETSADELMELRCRVITRNCYNPTVTFYSLTQKEYLWSLRLTEQRQFSYGILPNRLEQIFPFKNKQPRTIKLNEDVAVIVTYQYDDEVPSISESSFILRLKAGRVLLTRSKEAIRLPRLIEDKN